MTPNDRDAIARVIADAIRPWRDKAIEALSVANAMSGSLAESRERIAALDGQLSAHRLVLTDMRTPAPAVSHHQAGIDDISVEMVGDRTLHLCFVLTDGRKIDKEVSLPIPLHHGRWEKDRSYGLGDEVANNGCTWRAKRATTTEPPSADWVLVAKQGAKGGAA